MRLTICYRIYTPVKSRVRGGGNNGSKTQSSTMKRIVELFGERGVKKEFQTRKGSSQRTVSVTSMTDGKLQHNDKWAEDVLTSFAFSAPMVSRNMGTVEPQETPTCSTSVPSTDRNIQVDLVPGSRMDSHFQDLVCNEPTQTSLGLISFIDHKDGTNGPQRPIVDESDRKSFLPSSNTSIWDAPTPNHADASIFAAHARRERSSQYANGNFTLYSHCN